MSVAECADIHPGEKVLDLCAAPGGKSTQLAAKLQGEGLLVSNEIVPNRAKILSQNMERMGVKNAVVTNERPEKLEKYFKNYLFTYLFLTISLIIFALIITIIRYNTNQNIAHQRGRYYNRHG